MPGSFQSSSGGPCSTNSIASANKEMKVGATSDGLCCMELFTILLFSERVYGEATVILVHSLRAAHTSLASLLHSITTSRSDRRQVATGRQGEHSGRSNQAITHSHPRRPENSPAVI